MPSTNKNGPESKKLQIFETFRKSEIYSNRHISVSFQPIPTKLNFSELTQQELKNEYNHD